MEVIRDGDGSILVDNCFELMLVKGLGDLGKMTLVKITEQKILMEVELSTQNH